MMLVAAPMFLLYEGSILFAALGKRAAERRRRAREKELEEDMG
jgi:Sec-independent protein secretion pathway component TatC